MARLVRRGSESLALGLGFGGGERSLSDEVAETWALWKGGEMVLGEASGESESERKGLSE